MAYSLFNKIADMFITLFQGSSINAGVMITLIIISVIIILLMVAKAGKIAMVMILMPLIVTIAITASSITIPRWIAVVIWIVAGVLFASVFWIIMK